MNSWEQKYEALRTGLCLALGMDTRSTSAEEALSRVPALMAAAQAASDELAELRRRCTLCPEKDARIAELQALLARQAALGELLLAQSQRLEEDLKRLGAQPGPAAPSALPEVHNLASGDLIIARGSREHFDAYFAQYRALVDLAERAKAQGIYVEVLVLRPDIPVEKLSEEQMAKAGWQRTPGWLDEQMEMAQEKPGPERVTLLEIE